MHGLSQTLSRVVAAIGAGWDTWPYKNYIYCLVLSYIFNILHFQELLLTQELQLALYQR